MEESIFAWMTESNTPLTCAVCTLCSFILLTDFPARYKDRKWYIWMIPKLLCMAGAYYAASALGRVIGAIFSDTWEALLQLYFSLIAEGVIAGVLVRDCRVRTRIINLFMFFSSYLLSSSLNIMFGTYFISAISSFATSFSVSLVLEIPRLLLCVVIIVFMKWRDIDRLESANHYDVFLFSAVACIIFALHIYTFLYAADLESTNLFSVLILVMEWIIYVFYYLFMLENDRHVSAEAERQRLNADIRYYAFMQQNFDTMRLLKHDMNNQFAYISMLYSQGEDEAAKEYFAEINEKTSKAVDFVSTGNKPIDIAINLTSERMADAGVEFTHVCAVPSELPIDDQDLYSLSINLLDNAGEAAAKAEEGKRQAWAEFRVDGAYLWIIVKNTFAADADAENMLKNKKSTKRDAKNHGLGHRIVEEIAHRYEGEVLYRITDGVFSVEVMMALREADGTMKSPTDR